MRSKFVYDREKEHRKSKEKNKTGTVTDALPDQKMPSAYTIKELQLTIGTIGFNSHILLTYKDARKNLTKRIINPT